MTLIRAVDLGGLDTRSAALAFSGMEAGELPLHVAAADLTPMGADGARTVLVIAETGPLPLLPLDETEGDLIAELYVYALGVDGRLRDYRTRAFRLDLAAHGAALESDGLLVLSDLRLAPGEYSLRVLLLHRRSGRLGLRTLTHMVPGGGDSVPAAAPLFAKDTAGRLVIDAGDTAALDSLVEGASLLPTADPQIAPGATPWLWIPGEKPAGRSEVLIRSDGAADVALFSLAEPDPATAATAGAARLARIGPFDLPAGEYRLRVRTAPGEGGVEREESPERSFTIGAPPPPLAPPASASSIEGSAGVRADSGKRAPGTSVSDAPRDLEVVIAYRDSVKPAGRDRRGWDLQALTSLETATSGGREEETLQGQQVQLAQRLARQDAEALVPLLHLHGQLYPAYLRAERYDAAQHASALVRHLARLYSESSRSPERQRISAAALASLGGYRQEVGAELEARSAYLAALELDATQTAALVGAACVHESFGDYSTAADLLRRAVRAEPHLAEARLRLAINERRLGADRRALASLRKLAGGDDVPTWVSILAYQELAVALIADSRFGEAEGVLAAGMDRHPANQRLAIQRAAVLDHLRRPAEARRVLDGIEPDHGDESSPRFRYAGVPAGPLAEARRLLADAAAERRQNALQLLVSLAPESHQ